MKVRVRNLAKIREAEIEVKPLTIFVGKNGTNKSYMAHVVYGVYTVMDDLEDILRMKFRRLLSNYFTPITKADYKIEKITIEDNPNMEKIVFHIATDGQTTPKDLFLFLEQLLEYLRLEHTQSLF